MSRRRVTKKRSRNVDPLYGSIVVRIIVNHCIRHGKKLLSSRIIYSALDKIKRKTGREPLIILEHAIRIVLPTVQLKSRRVGGATYQVPVEVNTRRGVTIAIKWILKSAHTRPGRNIVIRLSAEIMDAANGNGGAVQKREEIFRMAEANKSFVRYRFLT